MHDRGACVTGGACMVLWEGGVRGFIRGGVRERGGMHDRGACMTGGGWGGMRATHTPPVNRITDRCKT